jgi:hypothetical protein
VRKTPSALKWLAEERGRTAQELADLERVLAEASRRRAALSDDLAAIDRTIARFDESIDPKAIAPVRTNGRYGSRGTFLEVLLDILAKHAPLALSTGVIALAVLARFPQSFDTKDEYRRWWRNSLATALRHMAMEGKVEREHEATFTTGEMGRWRLARPKVTSLADLRALASGGAESNDPERTEVDGGEAGARRPQP